MSKKKFIWIFILIAVIIAIVGAIVFFNNASSVQKIKSNETGKNLGSVDKTNIVAEEIKIDTNTEYEKIDLDDGTLYTITGKKEEADMVIGTNYYDTTITDIFYNPQNYMNKKIEIEGMYLLSGPNMPYTFVGRYSTNSLCPSCPAGYSVLEYQLQGKLEREFKDEKDWIKVIGTLGKGNDETSNFQDYYFLKALNIEVMNEKGEDTVKN